MSEKMMQRLQIQDLYIAQLRAAAEDDTLSDDWKLYSIREIFREMDDALRALEG